MTVLSVKVSLNKNLNHCIMTTTEFNSNRRRILERLFSQNSKAKALRRQRQMTERVYRASPPQTKAAAFAALQIVKGAQRIFRLYQKTILEMLKMNLASFKIKVVASGYSIKKNSSESLVVSYPKNSDSPSYKPSYNFSEVSKILLNKSMILNKNFPVFFKNLLKYKRGSIECGSNLIASKRKKIQIKLLGGKSF